MDSTTKDLYLQLIDQRIAKLTGLRRMIQTAEGTEDALLDMLMKDTIGRKPSRIRDLNNGLSTDARANPFNDFIAEKKRQGVPRTKAIKLWQQGQRLRGQIVGRDHRRARAKK